MSQARITSIPVEWTIASKVGRAPARLDLQRAIESFRDVLDRDFVGERPVAAGVNHRDVVAAVLEDAAATP